MAMDDRYYSLTLNASGTTDPHYCSIQPDPNISFVQGGFSCAPTATSATSVTIYPQVAQLQFPPSIAIAGGVTIVTGEAVIAGGVTVSPAATAPFTVKLYGAGSKVLGQATIEVGETNVKFSWNTLDSGATLDHATGALKSVLG